MKPAYYVTMEENNSPEETTVPKQNDDRLIRSINVDPKVWEAAKAKAKEEGTSMSKVLRNALEVYVKGAPNAG